MESISEQGPSYELKVNAIRKSEVCFTKKRGGKAMMKNKLIKNQQKLIEKRDFDVLYRLLKQGQYEDFRDIFFTLKQKDQVDLYTDLYPKNKTRLTQCLSDEELTLLFEAVEEAAMKDGRDEESIIGMTKARLPWIVALIFLGLISANLIQYFEDTIAKEVALAAFMPIILDSSGNVGTQSLATAVRRFAFKQDSKETSLRMMINEFGSGFLIGLASGLAMVLVVVLITGNQALAMVAGLSIWITLTLASVIGYLIPLIFTKIGIDPAVASGPFITTLCDTFALIIYFSLASIMMIYL